MKSNDTTVPTPLMLLNCPSASGQVHPEVLQRKSGELEGSIVVTESCENAPFRLQKALVVLWIRFPFLVCELLSSKAERLLVAGRYPGGPGNGSLPTQISHPRGEKATFEFFMCKMYQALSRQSREIKHSLFLSTGRTHWVSESWSKVIHSANEVIESELTPGSPRS